MKRSLLIVFALLMSVNIFAQQWTYQGYFPTDPAQFRINSGNQFIVVDPDGNIWTNPYSTDYDSLYVQDSAKYKKVRPIYVFKADGTPLDTVKSVTIGGKEYPLYGFGYGIEKDNDGNILACKGTDLVKIDYKTRQGLAILVNPLGGSICSPAVDAEGKVYICKVLAGGPIMVLNGNDLTVSGNAVDTLGAIGRYIEVSKDGNTIYAPRFTAANVTRFRRADIFGTYEVDTVLRGIVCESGIWDPKDTTKLWLSTGNYLAGSVPSGEFAGTEGSWFMFDTATWSHSDSIRWNFAYPGLDLERPRGLAFSLDGTTAYATVYGGINDSAIQTFKNPAHTTNVTRENNSTVNNYTLSQNYPNPFNPSTTIRFSVVNPGMITLKVYNIIGQVVATLVNENLSNGEYKVEFDGTNLSSGTYIYELSTKEMKLSRKMTLVK